VSLRFEVISSQIDIFKGTGRTSCRRNTSFGSGFRSWVFRTLYVLFYTRWSKSLCTPDDVLYLSGAQRLFYHPIYIYIYITKHFLRRCGPARFMASFLKFLDHTQRRTTVGRPPLD